MKKAENGKVELIRYNHHKRRVWTRLVSALAVVVVFVTTYMLILPAITMENEASCGITEHQHDAGCYSSIYEPGEKRLSCTAETLGLHTHNQSCFDAEGKLICGYADYVIHSHDAGCYDAAGTLVCPLAEHSLHVHTAACLQSIQQLICIQKESAGHIHDAACYTKQQGNLLCSEAEHTHGEDCYDAEGALICSEAEHTHEEQCYEWNDVLICTLPESEGHAHSESCYETVQVLSCEEPSELHTHTDACYQAGVLACGKTELKEHQHGEDCYTQEQVLVETLICDQQEHVHTDECYARSAEETKSESENETECVSAGSESESSEEETETEESTSEEAESEEISTEAEMEEEVSSEEETENEIEESTSEEVESEEISTEVETEEKSSEEASSEAESESGSAEKESTELETEEAGESQKDYDYRSWNLEINGPLFTVEKIITSSSSRVVLYRLARSVSVSGIDFGPYITDITFFKIQSGYWIPIQEGEAVKEGDQVRFYISYDIPDGKVNSSNKEIYYQLPSGVKLRKEESGSIYRNGLPVGTYIITEDGLIKITFEDEFVTDGRQFSGNIWFEGTVSSSGTNDKGEIEFGGEGGTLKVEKQEETIKNDISIEKSGSASKDGKTVDYTIVASSKNGSASPVTIEDYFRASEPASAEFDLSSFKIYKEDDYGNEIEVTGYVPELSMTSDGYPKFTLKDLPELKAGERYIVKYTANISIDNSNEWDGAAIINNAAKASIEVDSKETWSSVEVLKAVINKTGGYDSDENEINWTVTLNQGGKDIQGYTFSDTLPEGIVFIGAEFDVIDISVSPNKSIGKATVENGCIKYTFETDQSYTGTYRITYMTTAPEDNGTVNNTGTIGKDGEQYSSTAGVGVSHRDWGVGKTYKSEEATDDGTKRLIWSSRVSLPDIELKEFIYKDTIVDAVGGNSSNHYAIAKELQEEIENNLVLQLKDDSRLAYNNDKFDVSVTYYDEFGNTILSTDEEQKVKSFEIKITPKEDSQLYAKYAILESYSTHADVSGMQPGTSWAFKNKAELPEYNKESEATHTIKKDKILSKQSIADMGRDYDNTQGSLGITQFPQFTDGSKELTYDSLKDGYVYYRILIQAEDAHDEEIYITDYIPEGMTVDDNSVEGWYCFEEVNYQSRIDYWTSEGQNWYDFETNKKPDVEIDGSIMHITIQEGYMTAAAKANKTNWKLAITYRASIKDEWKELNVTEKTYVNKAEWGPNSDSQTTTVTRPIIKVQKSGELIKEYDEGGNVAAQYAEYAVVINPAGADINPYSDTLSLSDTLTLPTGVSAYLDFNNTGLYYYDATKEKYKGVKINSSKYILTYDEVNHVMNLVIPDETACVFLYRYRIDIGNSATAQSVSNRVKLYGKFESITTTQIEAATSGADVNKTLKIYKVDANDYTNLLSGAVFGIEKFDTATDNGAGNWVKISNDSDENGYYISDQNGEIELSCGTFLPNILYKLTEITAPDGYSIAEPIYFVFKASDGTDPINAIAGVLETVGVNRDLVKVYGTTSVDMYVPNENTEISVKKVWENKDGSIMTDPPVNNINVNLYRQEQQLAKWTVTVTRVYPNGSEQHFSYEVAKGSPFVFRVIDSSVYKNADEFESIQVDMGNWFQTYYDLKIASVTEDTNITLETTRDWLPYPECYYDKPGVYEEVENTKQLVESVTLSKDENWSKTWSDLPRTGINSKGETVPYYYTIEENVTLPGYKTTYLNNSGIQTGIIYITNRKQEDKTIVLPETGGSGTDLYTLSGLFLMAGATLLMYINSVKKGGRQIR